MADRYLVATGDYDTTAVWSASSGGAPGASVPTASDVVRCDANSGSNTLTITHNAACRAAYCFGFTGTIIHPAGVTWLIGDSTSFAWTLMFPLSMTYTATAPALLKFVSTGATLNNIAIAGHIPPDMTFDGVGGQWRFWLGTPGASTTNVITLLNGTLVSLATLQFGSFESSNSNVRTLNLGNSMLILSNGFNCANSTNMTITSGAFTIRIRANGVTFAGGGLDYGAGSLEISYPGGSVDSGTITITGANTFTNLTRLGQGGEPSQKPDEVVLAANQTITGTLTLTGVWTNRRILVRSSVLGTTRTITAAVVSLNKVDFMDITGAGVASPFTGTTIGDCLGNSGITFITVTRYWIGNSGDWSDTAHWSTSSGGAGGASAPLPQDTAIFDANSVNTQSDFSIDDIRFCKNLISTSLAYPSNTLPEWSYLVYALYGSLTLEPNFELRGSFSTSLELRTRSAATITAPTYAIWNTGNVRVYAFGGSLTQQGNTEVNILDLRNGTWDMNGHDLEIIDVFLGNTGTATRALLMGSGTIDLIRNLGGTIWNTGVSLPVGLTINAETSLVDYHGNVGPGMAYVYAGGVTFHDFKVRGVQIGGNLGLFFLEATAHPVTFSTLTVEDSPRTLQILAWWIIGAYGKLIFTTDFDCDGDAGDDMTIKSSHNGNYHELSKASGTVEVNYCDINDSHAIGGATWNAYNSVDGGGNTGWNFMAAAGSLVIPRRRNTLLRL